MIYLDHAATTPVPRAVADTMYTVLTEHFGNPSAQYPMGLETKKQVELWRRTVAKALVCESRQLFFTSCGTEGDNWAIQAACWQNRRLGRHILTPDGEGVITAQQVLDAVRPDTALVSCMLVNNELGTIYPIQEISRGLAAKNPQTLLHTDAVQGFLKIPFSAKTLGADFITISAHKIGGPKGIGALYIGPRVKNPRPLLPGGGQEGGLRSGTEATAQIAGFAKAVELRTEGLEDKLRHMAEIKAYAKEQLSAIPDLVFVGRSDAPHILSVSLVGWPSQNIVNDLGSQGICISAGSACHQGKPSQVVAALHLPKKTAGSVVRLSFGPETTREDIDACVQALRRHHDTRMPML